MVGKCLDFRYRKDGPLVDSIGCGIWIPRQAAHRTNPMCEMMYYTEFHSDPAYETSHNYNHNLGDRTCRLALARALAQKVLTCLIDLSTSSTNRCDTYTYFVPMSTEAVSNQNTCQKPNILST